MVGFVHDLCLDMTLDVAEALSSDTTNLFFTNAISAIDLFGEGQSTTKFGLNKCTGMCFGVTRSYIEN